MKAREFDQRRCARALVIALLLLGVSVPAKAVQVESGDSVRAAARDSGGVSPRGAMLRSFVLPGWGQAAVGSMGRAGVWFVIEGADVFMLVKTLRRLGDVQDRERGQVRTRTDSLNAAMAEDTALARRLSDRLAFDSAVGADPEIQHARALIESRTQQRQDWITYTLFFTLLSGVDAYVNAHLRDFPVDISMRNTRDGAVVLRLDVPLGQRPRNAVPAIQPAPALPPRRW